MHRRRHKTLTHRPPTEKGKGVIHLNRDSGCGPINVPPILATILHFNVLVIIAGGFFVSLAIVVLFALFFWAYNQDCFVGDDSTHGKIINETFQKMFALSAQTFTSVGYGGIYPRCIGTNILMTLEWYIAVVVSSIVAGIIIVNLLSPLPMVRWSKQVLLTKWVKKDQLSTKGSDAQDNDGNEIKECLTFRLISESPYQLIKFRLEAVAYVLRIDEEVTGDPVGVFIDPLPLQHSENVMFHQFGATHVLDESSPLIVLLREGKWHLLQKIVCVATYHDPRFKTDCTSCHTYWNSDLVKGATFKPMVKPGEDGDMRSKWFNRTYDHAMLDEFESQNHVALEKMPSHPLPDGMA